MGIVSSKWLKHDSEPSTVNTAVQTETPKGVTQISDVRSPTANIERTPIIVERPKPEENSPGDYRSLPLRSKLLKSLKIDPRSPTIGIYRTPILIEDTPPVKTEPNNFDSPVSVYSSNVNDSLVEDIMTPIEPSVNVSGFEVPKEIYCGENDVTIGSEDFIQNDNYRSQLKISDRPNTYEAKKLLEEIMSDEENFIKKVKMPSKKAKKSNGPGKSINEVKVKFRPPLSNITSTTNSPGNINTGIKLLNRNKAMPELGFENLVSPNTKQVVQWDQNNTVII